MYSKVIRFFIYICVCIHTHTHTHTHIFFFRFFSIRDYYKTLTVVASH